MELLSKKKIMESIGKCDNCGTKYSELTRSWIIEDYIRAGKKRLKKA